MNKTSQLFFLSLTLITSFFFFSDFSYAKIVISKIQISGVSTTDEFVELYNYSSSSVSLLDWNLKKQTAGGTQSYLVSSFPSSTVLNPFSYFLIAHRDYAEVGGVAADLKYSNNSTSLAANNSLLLFDQANNLIDEVSWGTVSSTASPARNPDAKKSLVRLPNNDGGNFIDTDNSNADFIELDSLPYNSLSPARPWYDSATFNPVNAAETPTMTAVASSMIIPNDSETTISIPTKTRSSKSTAVAATPAKNTITLIWNVKVPTPIIVGSSTLFDAHLTADPRGGEIFVVWDFGDGQTAEGTSVSHVFNNLGIFTVTASATSTQGTTGSKKIMIKVEPDTGGEAGIFLNGIAPRPEADGEEWISIGSSATNTVDLGGWRIGAENDHWYTLPASTTISPGMTLKFFRSATHLVLNNEGSTIFLEAPSRQTVDVIAYDKSLPGQIYTRGENGWEWLPKIETAPKEKNPSNEDTAGNKGSGKIYHAISAADARNLPPGSLVLLTGEVESLPGAPGVNYFFMRDVSGGIEIYSNKKLFPNLNIGDTVRVLGETGSFQNTIRVKTKFTGAITKLKNGAISEPERKTISEIDDGDYGTLVSLEGEITKIKSSFFYLDDGAEAEIALPKNSDIDKHSLREGDKIHVTGIIIRTNPTVRLIPRASSDLTVSDSRLPDAISSSTASSTNKVIVGTSGGLTLLGLAWAARKWLIKSDLS